MTKQIRISIADDHPMVIDGIKNMLKGYKAATIIDTYNDGAALMEGLKTSQPDILLLDIQMPEKSGDELAPVIMKRYPTIKILTLTNFDSTLHVQNMLRHGVLGYLLKTTDKETLINAIETVYRGEVFLQSEMSEKLDHVGLRMKREVSTKSNLSPREMEILQCIVNGDSSPEIAEKLFLSVRTVDNYRVNILLKLDVKNIATLVRKALEMGLVK